MFSRNPRLTYESGTPVYSIIFILLIFVLIRYAIDAWIAAGKKFSEERMGRVVSSSKHYAIVALVLTIVVTVLIVYAVNHGYWDEDEGTIQPKHHIASKHRKRKANQMANDVVWGA